MFELTLNPLLKSVYFDPLDYDFLIDSALVCNFTMFLEK